MGPDDFVFSMPDGTNVKKVRLYKVWVKAYRDAGVKRISLQQAFRHSTASEIEIKYETRLLKGDYASTRA